MPSEILTIQVGQCGNRIGASFWQKLCAEHGIEPDGRLKSTSLANAQSRDEFRGKFFYENDRNYYVPRTILVDLEPRPINSILASKNIRLYNRENILIANDKSKGDSDAGSGNNWFVGHSRGKVLNESIFEIIDREVENCESLDGFIICHSLAGGTGSGMGSYLLEQLAARYPKKFTQTFSVFPNYQQMPSDIVVQPYNSILTLNRLGNHADSVIVFDNCALHRMAAEQKSGNNAKELQVNKIIANAMAMATSTLRYSTFGYNTLHGLYTALTSHPNLHFLMTSYRQLDNSTKSILSIHRNSVSEVMKDLINKKNMLVCQYSEHDHINRYIAMIQLLRGQFDSTEIPQATLSLRKMLKFPAWCPTYMPVIRVDPTSSSMESNAKSCGLMIANHTSISKVFEQILEQFDKLKNRKAFLTAFLGKASASDNEVDLIESRESVQQIFDDYSRAITDDYIDWKRPNRNGDSKTVCKMAISKQSQRRGHGEGDISDQKVLDRLSYANQLLKKLSSNDPKHETKKNK